jgi:hypothetical protein
MEISIFTRCDGRVIYPVEKMSEKKLFYDERFGINGVGNPTALNPLWQQTNVHRDCVGFFTEYHKCYVQADIPERECLLWKEDYNECKLHFKEVCFYSNKVEI